MMGLPSWMNWVFYFFDAIMTLIISIAIMTLIITIEWKSGEGSIIGKNHALKKYDLFTLNTSCFWISILDQILTPVVQFHEILDTLKIMYKLIYYC